MRLLTARHQFARVRDDLGGHLEGFIRVEAQNLFGGGHLVSAQGRAVHTAGVHLGGSGVTDDRAQRDERRAVGDRTGVGQCFFKAGDVLTTDDGLYMPAVRLVAGGGVLRECDLGVVLNGDLIVIPDDDEVSELLSARQRRGLRSHALFDIPVGGDDVDEVIERAGTGGGVRIEQATLVSGGHRHADRGGQALAQRPGGDLHTLGVVVLGVPGSQGAPGA